eukprot:GHVQ01019785.1.p1 GENE.GHVQ01019785.1~~GHVQ01019785.1.p1  ORF type:complete len:103 (+),score=14.41 GHVQ01019785.1:376-684(+)
MYEQYMTHTTHIYTDIYTNKLGCCCTCKHSHKIVLHTHTPHEVHVFLACLVTVILHRHTNIDTQVSFEDTSSSSTIVICRSHQRQQTLDMHTRTHNQTVLSL